MREWIKGYLTPPTFEGDVEKTLLAQKVHIILLVNLLGTIIAIIVLLLAAPERLIRVAPIFPVLVFLIFVNRRGGGKAAVLLLIVALWLLITMTAVINGGIRAPGTPVYVVIILFVAMLFGMRTAMTMAFLCALTGLGLVYAEKAGLLVSATRLPTPLFIYWFAQVMTYYATIGLVYLAIRDVREALARAHQELTEHQRADEKLRESEANYRGAIIAAGFVPYNIDYQKKSFTFIGDDIFKLTGYTAEEITPALLKECIQEEYLWGPNADMTANEARRMILSGVPLEWRQDMLIRAKTGENRWLSDTSVEIRDDNGKAIGGIGIFQDITERKQAETERENLIKNLEAQNTELERFTYTVSHDLTTPLVTIRGYLGYLEQDAKTGNLVRMEDDVRRIENATDRMHSLLKDLLELSRIGRLMNPPEMIPFEDLVQEVLEIVHGRLEARGVAVQSQPNLPAIYGDRQRLMEVLQNLIDNSAKYMGDQPNPRIEIGQRSEENGKPIFFVKDNGIGIAPEYHERVFGLFNKLDPQAEGTGIGLALVKRIIEFHGCRIWIESEEAKGSTFCFTLPTPPESKTTGDW